jgi:endonuclease YncB( thermonuclease family)
MRAGRRALQFFFVPERRRSLLAPCLAAFVLCACGPKIGDLERGESGRVVRAYNGDTLELDTGLRVFLAEIDAPRGEDAYASQARGELEALALHREVRLAYGGAKRWTAPPREGDTRARPETAIAHVFVKSEGGRWFWLQHALVSRGAAFVRPRPDNHARTPELLRREAQARAAERGLWRRREHRALDAGSAADAALLANASCQSGEAPYRVVEGRVESADVSSQRAALRMASDSDEAVFALVLFGERFAEWEGPRLESLAGARVRARGPLGVFDGEPQLCLEHASQLEVLPEG